ncbi:hypothetical protein [Cloacibacillus evryensis]|uniref:hypothetical protein n=1 Tax=Cloacibacillus evryensis TaxID=508460 RepID=UPI00146FC7F4|nr:hypothetical protein [Cloacibacillus evryensis]MEA5034503.1 hypothetical protein [Cloacibacillus evryensis]
MKCLKPKDLGCVIVDTTVQENDITFPTDLKLYAKGIELLVREAKRAGVKLKRTYARTVPVLRRASWQFSRRRKYRKAAAYCDKGYRGKAKHKEIPCVRHPYSGHERRNDGIAQEKTEAKKRHRADNRTFEARLRDGQEFPERPDRR